MFHQRLRCARISGWGNVIDVFRNKRDKTIDTHMKRYISRKAKTKYPPLKHGPKHLVKAPVQEKGPDGELKLFQPVEIPPITESDAGNIGEEIAGKLTTADVTQVFRLFAADESVRKLAQKQNIDGVIYENCVQNFRKFCLQSTNLPVELHITFKDIVTKAGHPTDVFPYFLQHARQVYPHLECMDDLKKISDLTEPTNWYPLARSIKRKVIFHAGPTNSGKTYHALKRFMNSENGIYCGPLRLLAMEIFDKCKAEGVPCDLVTGETRKYVNEDGTPASHTSSTVEMTNLNQTYDVAVIDEIQMISDLQRGWSWTRALLGVPARELHVCGEETAIELVEELINFIGDEFEVKRYDRLTSLTYQDQAVGGFEHIQPGDCIVCFSKKSIFSVVAKLTSLGHKVAVIYGSLPPGTKIQQSQRFNDPEDPCNVLVATDAVGMGLNLAIKRVIFFSLQKMSLMDDSSRQITYLSTSQAQQIAGRAGRFRTQFEDGFVTTFYQKDLKLLQFIVKTPKEPLKKAGLNPTLEMVEMFSYHLPKATISNILDIFVGVCSIGDMYFMCNLDEFKQLSILIEDLPLTLKMKYTLCSAPMTVNKGYALVMFRKIAKRLSEGVPLTYDWLCQILGTPFRLPRSIAQLEALEGAFDIVDIYLWLSYRYGDMFLDVEQVQDLRGQLDGVIQAYIGSMKGQKSHRHKNEKVPWSTIYPEQKRLAHMSGEGRTSVSSKDDNPTELTDDEFDPESTIKQLEVSKTEVKNRSESVKSQDEVVISYWTDDAEKSSLDVVHDEITDRAEIVKENDNELMTDSTGELEEDLDETQKSDVARDEITDRAEIVKENDNELMTDSTGELQEDLDETQKSSENTLVDRTDFNDSVKSFRENNMNLNSGKDNTYSLEGTEIDTEETLSSPEHIVGNNNEPKAKSDNFVDKFKSALQKQDSKRKILKDSKTLKSATTRNDDTADSVNRQSKHNGTNFAEMFKIATSNIKQSQGDRNGGKSASVLDDNSLSSNGKLTDRLVQDGILSKDLLKRLQLEWKIAQNKDSKDDS